MPTCKEKWPTLYKLLAQGTDEMVERAIDVCRNRPDEIITTGEVYDGEGRY